MTHTKTSMPKPIPLVKPLRLRTVWLSDVHLGTKDCRADELLAFLNAITVKHLYIVGDLVDLWSMRRNVHWNSSHNAVIRKLIELANNGTQVIYVPGNHDEAIRDYHGLVFGEIPVLEQAIHTTADGRRLLVMHGDEFDGTITCARWLTHLGSWTYDRLLVANRWLNIVRRQLGLRYWSLAAAIKQNITKAVSYIEGFEQAAVMEARAKGTHGVVCGHIHHPALKEIDGITYCNDGDWVESCSALSELPNGRLQLIYWNDAQAHCVDTSVEMPVAHAA